ncbi:MAG TPA: efflux RND transporter periplasmic adaptor subunit [Aliidongia sp.]|nr:efflux RND transporter periplasmic adaptor subunit [Aliidongia sp.]
MTQTRNIAPKSSKPRLPWGAGLVGLIVFLALAAWGISTRLHAEANLKDATEDAAIPTVVVAKAQAGPAVDEIVLPGTVQAKFDTPIFARTSGYLKKWYTDIGTRVKAGQLLAEIESPEIDQQLRQAQADLVTAQANNRLAQSTAKRFQSLLATDSVSKQEEEDRTADAAAKAALVSSAEANVERLRQLVGFERVVAPYDGVVTARETDIGNLINAGSSTGAGLELFRVADTSKLRIYVQVPQTYSSQIKPGISVSLRFPEHAGKEFPADLVRTSDALDPRARTLLVELQVDNANGELLPGGYTEVHMKLNSPDRGVRLPVSALLFRAEGLRIATVEPDGHAKLHEVTLGRDFGTAIEILTGIGPDDQIIVNPPASLLSGDQVRIAGTPPSNAVASGKN